MRIITVVFYLILILFGVSFAALNATKVLVNFYFTTLSIPISVLMALMLGFGMMVGVILSTLRYWRLKVAYHRVTSQLKLKEKEINNLRAMPVDKTFSKY